MFISRYFHGLVLFSTWSNAHWKNGMWWRECDRSTHKKRKKQREHKRSEMRKICWQFAPWPQSFFNFFILKTNAYFYWYFFLLLFLMAISSLLLFVFGNFNFDPLTFFMQFILHYYIHFACVTVVKTWQNQKQSFKSNVNDRLKGQYHALEHHKLFSFNVFLFSCKNNFIHANVALIKKDVNIYNLYIRIHTK